MPTATINGKEVTVPRGTAIIRAAAMLGINVPHFCYHPALSAPANCRMCLVEVEKARKLEPACYLKVTDGMVVHTESEKVVAARQAVLEFILINHPVDCPICDQAGECKLQDYYMAYDAKPSRLTTGKVGKVKVYPIGPEVVYDGERCILCTRCVRFCDQITGTSELTVVDRGDRSEIRTFPGRELDNPYSMNVTDICPVGALTTRDFRFKCRVWLMTSTDSICTGCARGCSVHLDHYLGETQRYRPRFNPEVNEYWMCDEGRLSYKRLNANRSGALRVGERDDLSWPRAARMIAGALADAQLQPDQIAFVASADASTEALVAGHEYALNILRAGRFYWTGRADGEGDAFLRCADRNPNRAGLVHSFGEQILERGADRLLKDLKSGGIRALFMMSSALPFGREAVEELAAEARKLDIFILATSHAGSLSSAATVSLPVAKHSEQTGTWVNIDGVAQTVDAAYAPPGVAIADWDVYRRLAAGADAEWPLDSVDAIHARIFSDEAAE